VKNVQGSPSKVTFKLANLSDTDSLVEMMAEFYGIDRHPFEAGRARNALQQILGDESLGRVWLIELKGSLIGYIVFTLGFSLEFHGRDAFIDEFYIRAEHQRQGFGEQALELIHETCRSLQVQALHLEVSRSNTNAQAAYRKYGFKDREQYLMTKWIPTKESL